MNILDTINNIITHLRKQKRKGKGKDNELHTHIYIHIDRYYAKNKNKK